jgi:predicted dehydrogenase
VKKQRIGIIGCGMISGNYLKNARDLYSDYYEITALSDIRLEQAQKQAKEFGINKVLTSEELLKDNDVDIILNLTLPKVHYEVIISCLNAGKHVYTEKPFGLSCKEAVNILETAKKNGLMIGCAPDTFLGMPQQTALKAIKAGYIGDIMGVNCVCPHPTHGNENWHPEPFFYYQKGAGPMFDMGAYYFNLLVALIGPVESIMSYATMNFPERKIKTLPHKGEYIHVEVPTHVIGMFQFKSGAVGTIMNTLDVWNTKQPFMEIYGTEGSLILPDPNHYTGDVLVSRLSYGENAWIKLPDLLEYKDTVRGIGIADMVYALEGKRPLRASGEMALHITEIINAFDEAAMKKECITLQTSCDIPKPRWEKYTESDGVL